MAMDLAAPFSAASLRLFESASFSAAVKFSDRFLSKNARSSLFVSPVRGSASRSAPPSAPSGSQIPTSFATWIAVRSASPVTMATPMPPCLSLVRIILVSRRTRQVKATKPANEQPSSQDDRACWADSTSFAAGRGRYASEMTRYPRLDSRVAASSYPSGFLARSFPTISGEPFTTA